MLGIERHDVGRRADRDRGGRSAERLRAAGTGGVEHRAPRGGAYRPVARDRGGNVARTPRQALAVFEQAQLFGGVDQHVAVGADAEPAAGAEMGREREHAVAEVRLGDRAQARDRGRRGERACLGLGHVGRVHEAPARIDRLVAEQPFDRALARPGEAVRDLLGLLGGVDVDRPVGVRGGQPGELFWRDGA